MCRTYKTIYNRCGHRDTGHINCKYHAKGISNWLGIRRPCQTVSYLTRNKTDRCVECTYMRSPEPRDSHSEQEVWLEASEGGLISEPDHDPAPSATGTASQSQKEAIWASNVDGEETTIVGGDEIMSVMVRNEIFLRKRAKVLQFPNSSITFTTPSKQELEHQYLVNEEFLARRLKKRFWKLHLIPGKVTYQDFFDAHEAQRFAKYALDETVLTLEDSHFSFDVSSTNNSSPVNNTEYIIQGCTSKTDNSISGSLANTFIDTGENSPTSWQETLPISTAKLPTTKKVCSKDQEDNGSSSSHMATGHIAGEMKPSIINFSLPTHLVPSRPAPKPPVAPKQEDQPQDRSECTNKGPTTTNSANSTEENDIEKRITEASLRTMSVYLGLPASSSRLRIWQFLSKNPQIVELIANHQIPLGKKKMKEPRLAMASDEQKRVNEKFMDAVATLDIDETFKFDGEETTAGSNRENVSPTPSNLDLDHEVERRQPSEHNVLIVRGYVPVNSKNMVSQQPSLSGRKEPPEPSNLRHSLTYSQRYETLLSRRNENAITSSSEDSGEDRLSTSSQGSNESLDDWAEPQNEFALEFYTRSNEDADEEYLDDDYFSDEPEDRTPELEALAAAVISSISLRTSPQDSSSSSTLRAVDPSHPALLPDFVSDFSLSDILERSTDEDSEAGGTDEEHDGTGRNDLTRQARPFTPEQFGISAYSKKGAALLSTIRYYLKLRSSCGPKQISRYLDENQKRQMRYIREGRIRLDHEEEGFEHLSELEAQITAKMELLDAIAAIDWDEVDSKSRRTL